jgi:hypothetical protein
MTAAVAESGAVSASPLKKIKETGPDLIAVAVDTIETVGTNVFFRREGEVSSAYRARIGEEKWNLIRLYRRLPEEKRPTFEVFQAGLETNGKGCEALLTVDELSLEVTELSKLPLEIGLLKNLRVLSLAHNDLEDLPSVMGQLKYLEELDLSWNKLTHLPSVLGQLTQLKILKINNRHLVSLDPDIGKLVNLEILWCDGEHVQALPPEIGQLTALQELTLQFNPITTLPKEMGNLTSLRALDLRRTRITELPLEMGRLHLSYLKLEDTQLRTLAPKILKNTGWIDIREKPVVHDKNSWRFFQRQSCRKSIIGRFDALGKEHKSSIFHFLAPRDRKVSQSVSKVFGRLIAAYDLQRDKFEALSVESRFNILDFLAPKERKANQLVSKIYRRLISAHFQDRFRWRIMSNYAFDIQPTIRAKTGKRTWEDVYKALKRDYYVKESKKSRKEIDDIISHLSITGYCMPH